MLKNIKLHLGNIIPLLRLIARAKCKNNISGYFSGLPEPKRSASCLCFHREVNPLYCFLCPGFSSTQAPAWVLLFLKLCFLFEAELHGVCAQAKLGHQQKLSPDPRWNTSRFSPQPFFLFSCFLFILNPLITKRFIT